MRSRRDCYDPDPLFLNFAVPLLNLIFSFKGSDLVKKVRDCRDESGLQFINFDLVTGGQEIKFLFWRIFEFF